RADARTASRVGRRVGLDPEPCRVAAHALANGRRVLTDPAGEDDRVESAERSGQRTELPPDSIQEDVDREPRRRTVTRQQGPHVAGDTRYAEEPGLAVEEFLDGPRIHLVLVHQIDDNAWIQRAAARAHRQPVG